jgi:hypothetical protein
MPTQNPNFISGGNINPKRFVTQQTDADLTVEESNAGDMPVGVSGIGTKYAPIPETSNTYHAESGDPVWVHGPGEECWLTAGGAVTAGDLLKPDNDGKGVTATAGDKYGARALAAASSGEDIRAFVMVGELET